MRREVWMWWTPGAKRAAGCGGRLFWTLYGGPGGGERGQGAAGDLKSYYGGEILRLESAEVGGWHRRRAIEDAGRDGEHLQ